MTRGTDATCAPPASDGADTDVAHPRAIRSFVTRAGRTTSGQARALAELGPRYVLPHDPKTPDLIAACAHQTSASGQKYDKFVLEIGFGMGHATAHIAALMPDTLFIGCEVHEPGVGALLKLMGEQGLGNIRIVPHDAVEVLRQMSRPPRWTASTSSFPTPGTRSATTSAA